MAGLGQGRAVCRAAQGGGADFIGMGVAGGFTGDDAKAEPLGRVIGGGLQATVIENQGFGLRAFQKKLAVIGALECNLQDGQGF